MYKDTTLRRQNSGESVFFSSETTVNSRKQYMPLFLTEEIEAYIIPNIPINMVGERRGLWKRQFTRTLLQKNSKSLILTVLHSWIFVNRMR